MTEKERQPERVLVIGRRGERGGGSTRSLRRPVSTRSTVTLSVLCGRVLLSFVRDRDILGYRSRVREYSYCSKQFTSQWRMK